MLKAKNSFVLLVFLLSLSLGVSALSVPGTTPAASAEACTNDPAKYGGAPDDPDPNHHMPKCPDDGGAKVSEPNAPAQTPAPVVSPAPAPEQPKVDSSVECTNDPAKYGGAPDDMDPNHHMPKCPDAPEAPVATPPIPAPSAPDSNPSLPNSLAGSGFFRSPFTQAQAQVSAWLQSRFGDAEKINRIAREPQAKWLVDASIENTSRDTKEYVRHAKEAGKIPVFVLYSIPNRDCGSYSAGGSQSRDEYLRWVGSISDAIGDAKSVVILEPDALTFNDCLDENAKEARYALVKDAVDIIAKGGTKVYIDAGHPEWIPVNDMAERLRKAGVDKAAGFAVNVSNFYSTESNTSYGTDISRQIGNKHFVIDTSRNGAHYEGSYGWCNPDGRKLGAAPTADTGNSLIDAFLWIKNPGESDGTCNGGPSAGAWWPDYALKLAD